MAGLSVYYEAAGQFALANLKCALFLLLFLACGFSLDSLHRDGFASLPFPQIFAFHLENYGEIGSLLIREVSNESSLLDVTSL